MSDQTIWQVLRADNGMRECVVTSLYVLVQGEALVFCNSNITPAMFTVAIFPASKFYVKRGEN